ncbi:MAG: DUF3035 domain-containing protein [Pseudomonadota bacterium]
MKRSNIFQLLTALGLLVALPACDSFRDQIGYSKSSPDEFRVVSRAPLSLPPDFSLRPPKPGAARPQVGTPTDQAKRAVFRVEDETAIEQVENIMPNDGRSLGERSLLVAAGAETTEPDIRQIVNRETNQINDEGIEFIDTLVFWRDEPPDGVVIDPEKEDRRLQENAALGLPPTEGETPIIERKEQAIFEGVF